MSVEWDVDIFTSDPGDIILQLLPQKDTLNMVCLNRLTRATLYMHKLVRAARVASLTLLRLSLAQADVDMAYLQKDILRHKAARQAEANSATIWQQRYQHEKECRDILERELKNLREDTILLKIRVQRSDNIRGVRVW